MTSNYKCCVAFCKNSSYNTRRSYSNIWFHQFPESVEIRQKWIVFCGNDPSWAPSPKNVICSEHFTDADYQLSSSQLVKHGHNWLNYDAVPSIRIIRIANAVTVHPSNNNDNNKYVKLKGPPSVKVKAVTAKEKKKSCCKCVAYEIYVSHLKAELQEMENRNKQLAAKNRELSESLKQVHKNIKIEQEQD